ncbi:MAG: shikimate dehydrogenase [Candidatus Hermodarchaeota archaeon]
MKLLAIVGYPLGHTMSPVMHNAALKEMRLESEFHYEQRPVRVRELSNLVSQIREGTLEGANITVPYKTVIMEYLSAVTDEGLAAGSVNTLYREGGKVIGHNTDVKGFEEALEERNVAVRGLRATILGAGGAARAVALALAEEGIERLAILNRTRSNALKLAESLGHNESLEVFIGPISTARNALEESDILINCTPIGMHGHSAEESPVDGVALPRDLIVMDLVYNPLRTRLLKDAEESGCKTIDGTGMLVHQGAEALRIWTGKRAPVEVMRNAVLSALEVGR